MDYTVEHLKMLQTIINRMASNSFMIKSWSITVIAAFLALYANSKNTIFIYISIIPVVLFYFLDAYYLQQERKFRGIYNDVAQLSSSDCTIQIKPFEMPVDKYKNGQYNYFISLKSKAVCAFYCVQIVVQIVIGSILSCK
jgi:hypothetical protein